MYNLLIVANGYQVGCELLVVSLHLIYSLKLLKCSKYHQLKAQHVLNRLFWRYNTHMTCVTTSSNNQVNTKCELIFRNTVIINEQSSYMIGLRFYAAGQQTTATRSRRTLLRVSVTAGHNLRFRPISMDGQVGQGHVALSTIIETWLNFSERAAQLAARSLKLSRHRRPQR